MTDEIRVRFECPICGGPHARADHSEPAPQPAPHDLWRQLDEAARMRLEVQQRLNGMTAEDLLAMRHALG